MTDQPPTIVWLTCDGCGASVSTVYERRTVDGWLCAACKAMERSQVQAAAIAEERERLGR